jgi:hypothetical protein
VAALLLGACASAPAGPNPPATASQSFENDRAPAIPTSRPGHTLQSVKDRVVGPTNPALRALQGQKPLVHVQHAPDCSGLHLGDAPVACPRRAGFELAVFQDGTLAFDGGTCARVDDLVIRQLTAGRLSALRAAVDRICPEIAGMQSNDCSHGDRLQITCHTHDRRASVTSTCGDPADASYRLALQVIERTAVVDLLGTPEQQAACPGGRGFAITSEIGLTVGPQHVRTWIYQPNP